MGPARSQTRDRDTMADQEQLQILKQGGKAWKAWRNKHPNRKIDFREADLRGVELSGADLSGAKLSFVDLREADLSQAHLSQAFLYGANLSFADLNGADLSEADLSAADLGFANLYRTRLSEANLFGANLREANLYGSDFSEANLSAADLRLSNLREADLSEAVMGNTTLGDLDLSQARGLETVRHELASTLGTSTLVLSKGSIPEVFLRGCGLSDWEIEAAKLHRPGLPSHELDEILYKIHELRANRPVQVASLFISYSHADSAFVDALERLLNEKGIRFWRDIHDLTAGRLEKQIDRAIRLNSTVLLVLSEHSTRSDWVEHEVHLARELEKQTQRDVLCPVTLDEAWKNSAWSQVLMEQVMKYNILSFCEWQEDTSFRKMFARLVDGLDLYYKKPEAREAVSS